MAKNNVTAKQKAKRQQHRKDHYTDADRSFNGKGQKARRAGRQENFNAQGNESAAYFDFDQHGKGHVSGQEISHLRKQGHSRADIMSAARAGGGELSGRAEKKFARWEAKAKAASGQQAADYSSANADAEAQKLADSYIDTIRPGTTTKMDTAIKNTQQQDIAQDNDQTSTITGDNNTVWQQQDNSIRQYGGDNRSFVYNGGNSGVDTPVSAMTMSGILDVDDSPAAQASFHDLHNTLNSDAQKKYSGSGMRIAGMFSNFDARGYDPAALESNIENSALESYDRASLAYNDTFGDMSANRGTLSDYKFGAEPKSVDYDKDDDDDD